MTSELVSVVVPLWNDDDLVERFVTELLRVLKDNYSAYEVILVDDGSTDDTVARTRALLLEHESLRLLRLSRHFGTEIAVSAGLDSAVGDEIVTLTAATDPPNVIPELVGRVRHGAGIVFGVRSTLRDENWSLRLGSRVFHWFSASVLDLHYPKNSTNFLCMSRVVVNALTRLKDRLRFLRVLSSEIGFRTAEVPYEPRQLRDRPRRRNLFGSLRLAAAITLANSTWPLRIAAALAVLVSMANAALVVYVLGVGLLADGIPPGWASESLHSSAMFCLLFLVVAVVCGYLDRVVDYTRVRPLYYLMQEEESVVGLRDLVRRNVVTGTTVGRVDPNRIAPGR